MSFFQRDARMVFFEAGLIPSEAPEIFEQVKDILSNKTAELSVTMGLSYKRLKVYEDQKQALIMELRQLKESGTLR